MTATLRLSRRPWNATFPRRLAGPVRLVNEAIGQVLTPKVVFIGDSITRYWLDYDPAFFISRRLNKGISGNTTDLMLDRFERDVVAHQPAAVHIMGGTNDLWYGDPGRNACNVLENLRQMIALAKLADVRVFLAPPPPITPASAAMFAHADLFPELRTSISNLCRERDVRHVDYAPLLLGDDHVLRASFTTDGVHLTRSGYQAIGSHAKHVVSRCHVA